MNDFRVAQAAYIYPHAGSFPRATDFAPHGQSLSYPPWQHYQADMGTDTNQNHFPVGQSTAGPEEPTSTDLALIAAQLVRTGGKTVQQGDDLYAKAAETAHKLWSACHAHLISVRKVRLNLTERLREHRRGQLRELGVSEPAAYPIDLRQFLILAHCPGRSHPDRLAKFRAWMRSVCETDDVSQFDRIEDFWRFSALTVDFWKWHKSQRSESAKRARTSKNIE